jgi:methylmalonyl-CoA mutase N-terminal domain/subunit
LQRPRRGAGAADRGVGAHRAEDAADHRGGNRRRQYGRSGRVEQAGGTLAAIESGLIQREIQESAYRAQVAIDSGQAVVVGVNRYAEKGSDEQGSGPFSGDTRKAAVPLFGIDAETERLQIARVQAVRAGRSRAEWHAALDAVTAAARDGRNLVPPIIAAVEAHATVGEIADTLGTVFGRYQDTTGS